MLLDDLTIEEAIIRCGNLKIAKDRIPLLLCEKLSKTEQIQLQQNLSIQNTIEYQLYAQGEADGDLKNSHRFR